MTFKDRIDVDVGRRLPIEDAALESCDEARCAAVRALRQREGVPDMLAGREVLARAAPEFTRT